MVVSIPLDAHRKIGEVQYPHSEECGRRSGSKLRTRTRSGIGTHSIAENAPPRFRPFVALGKT